MTEDYIKKAVRLLWKEAFGDSDEFIDSFMLRFYKQEHLLYAQENGQLVSMLHILPFTRGGEKIGYIYAVATAEKQRNKGYASFLLNKAIETAKREKFAALVTIPASKALRSYYERFGFKGEYRVEFSTPEGIDLGTGEKEKDLLSILPIKTFQLPGNEEKIRLEYQEGYTPHIKK